MDTGSETPAAATAVLDFWFGTLDRQGMPTKAVMQRWFATDPALDAEIRARFGADLAQLEQRSDWLETTPGRLAAVIVADQFSRNVHRGSARAFARDALALELALEAIDSGREHELLPIQRVFLYLPLEHAEDPELQARSVACFRQLATEVPPALSGKFEGFARFAEGHRDVIARFGRFPHRNRVLGRASTPEELAYLESEAPAWGQGEAPARGARAGVDR